MKYVNIGVKIRSSIMFFFQVVFLRLLKFQQIIVVSWSLFVKYWMKVVSVIKREFIVILVRIIVFGESFLSFVSKRIMFIVVMVLVNVKMIIVYGLLSEILLVFFVQLVLRIMVREVLNIVLWEIFIVNGFVRGFFKNFCIIVLEMVREVLMKRVVIICGR